MIQYYKDSRYEKNIVNNFSNVMFHAGFAEPGKRK
jgi:hypothetical protein